MARSPHPAEESDEERPPTAAEREAWAAKEQQLLDASVAYEIAARAMWGDHWLTFAVQQLQGRRECQRRSAP